MEFCDYIGSIQPLLVFLFTLILLIVIVRTIMFSFPGKDELPNPPNDKEFITAGQVIISRFCDALRFETVSRAAGDYNRDELLRFQKFLIKGLWAYSYLMFVGLEVYSCYSLIVYL